MALECHSPTQRKEEKGALGIKWRSLLLEPVLPTFKQEKDMQNMARGRKKKKQASQADLKFNAFCALNENQMCCLGCSLWHVPGGNT